MKPTRTAQRSTRYLAPFLGLALVASACGSGGGTTDSTAEAAVSVGSVESGCAEAIELTQMLNGALIPNMSSDDMSDLADGASSLSAAFPDRPSEVGDYLNLVRDVTRNAADSAAEQGDLSSEQVRLLLDFEMAGRRADFDRLAPSADNYFAAECGDSYSNAVATLAATPATGNDDGAVVASDDSTTSADTTSSTAATTTTDAGSKGELDEETTTTVAPAPGGEIIKDLSSVGATAQFLGVDLEVGEIWRTNLTAEAAVTGGSEMGDQTIVLVEIRLTSSGNRLFSNADEYGFVSADGFRTNASDAVLASGARWNLDLDDNESRLGYLVFEGGLSDLSTGTLQWIKDGVPANVPLGQGVTTPPYPVGLDLPAAPVASTSTNTNGCVLDFDGELRGASVALDSFAATRAVRAPANERFVSLDFAVNFKDATGESSSCQFVNSLFISATELRLRLDNGDSRAPERSLTGSVDKTSTEVFSLDFRVPDTTTSLELVDVTGTVFASWSGLELPAP